MSLARARRREPDWGWERRAAARGFQRVAGVDEVGRGCLAGPVVAAAVVFEGTPELRGLRDSKQLSERARQRWDERLRRQAAGWALGEAGAGEVDRLNILVATRLAMERAVAALDVEPDLLLVDALELPALKMRQWPLVRGDERSLSIAAASVIAKVHRDQFMRQMDALYPQYRFASHKGYGTSAHRHAVARWGPCALHRLTFHGVSSRRSLSE